MSDLTGTIERMFDSMFARATDAEVVAAIGQWTTAEAAAAAHRLAAIAELGARRTRDDERSRWACDGLDAAAAEVSAAMGIGHGRALSELETARLLRGRLPEISALCVAGRIHSRVIDAITWRTALVTDPEAIAMIDHALAGIAGSWNTLSRYKLDQAIDALVDRHDPGALRRTRSSTRGRGITIGTQNHETGTAELWGRLLGTDAAVLEHRLNHMARGVCDDDPRTLSQRRADALGALAAGTQTLACQCGDPDCPAAGPDARAASVVIHVLADTEALAAQPDPQMSGDGPTPDDDTARPPGSAVILGGAALPTPLLAELIRAGATVRHLKAPPAPAEPHYRPSTALDEFIRMRDLSCRFPGCDRPAQACDLDHRVPWPLGATHPSGLRALCRCHHLLKTFWTGWTDVQHPDGTIVWTSPTGHTYTTQPASRHLFPAWNTDTGPAPPATTPNPSPHRNLMMPTRRRTRTAERHYRTTRERALNDAHVAERNRPPPY